MELKDYSTEELKAELKRRSEEIKAKREAIPRCRMCSHWGEVDYWGNPPKKDEYCSIYNTSCQFFKTKNGKHYICHKSSQRACEHFERKES